MSSVIKLDKDQEPRLSTTEQAMLALTNAIHDGNYKPGQRLVEAHLTRELGISRGSLREVFRRLVANGLVELEPNRGAIVKRISRESVMEILATREVLEGLAAAQAAENTSRPEIAAKAESMLAKIRQLRDEGSELDYLADNIRFHNFIVALSENTTLQQQIEQLQLPGFRSRFFSTVSESSWKKSLGEHISLLETIIEGDSLLAEQLMRAHVRRTRRHFAALPETVFDA